MVISDITYHFAPESIFNSNDEFSTRAVTWISFLNLLAFTSRVPMAKS